MSVRLKRVYEPPAKSDGTRILVERLWPRGLTKQRAAVDVWMKDVAPSPELRKWFGHDPAKWREFQSRYRKELREHKAAVKSLSQQCADGAVTLIFSAHDEEHNAAVVLNSVLERRRK